MHSETLLKPTMQRSGLVFTAGRTILSLNKIIVYNIKYLMPHAQLYILCFKFGSILNDIHIDSQYIQIVRYCLHITSTFS